MSIYRETRKSGGCSPIEAFAHHEHEKAMALSSASLVNALKRYAAEVRHTRQASIPPKARKMPGFRARFQAEARPIASGRDPCPVCATRGDLGCPHFAPCEPKVPA